MYLEKTDNLEKEIVAIKQQLVNIQSMNQWIIDFICDYCNAIHSDSVKAKE